MARLTEEMVIARSKQSDLSSIQKLNCWGAEICDVSLLRRMPNIEVLAFSVNKIRELRPFGHCPALRELYIRKNEVRDLREIRHLRGLRRLRHLWLDENPCTQHPQYRHTVLRNLPQLELLDNLPVRPDEVEDAQRYGIDIPDSDDETCDDQHDDRHDDRRDDRHDDRRDDRREQPTPPDDSPHEEEPPSPDPQPDTHSPEWEEPVSPRAVSASHQMCWSPPRRPPPDDVMTRSQYAERAAPRPDDSMRHSHSAHSVKGESATTNGDCRPPPYEHDRVEVSAVMAERSRPGFVRRPITRNSNLLSAVLCLVKELDYPSLEVLEMAVRCRMDELANDQ